MAKAILVMDRPECCKECAMIYELRDTGQYYCYKTISYLGTDKDILNKPDWCPLIEKPDYMLDRENLDWEDGWNACVVYLNGGEE